MYYEIEERERTKMSKENHPNIHAVQVTTDLIASIKDNLRGKAGKHKKELQLLTRNILKCRKIYRL